VKTQHGNRIILLRQLKLVIFHALAQTPPSRFNPPWRKKLQVNRMWNYNKLSALILLPNVRIIFNSKFEYIMRAKWGKTDNWLMCSNLRNTYMTRQWSSIYQITELKISDSRKSQTLTLKITVLTNIRHFWSCVYSTVNTPPNHQYSNPLT
jgi:hypothetical protein